MSFWDAFGGDEAQSPMDKLLESAKGPESLKAIIDEDTFLQETKSRNRLLMDFLTKEDVLKEFLSLIATEPPEGCNDKRRYKLPPLSCEGLCSGAEPLVDACAREESLAVLLSFLDKPAPFACPAASTLACKAVAYLASTRPHAVLPHLESLGEPLVRKIAAHAESPGIETLLIKLCSDEETETWVADAKVVEALADTLSTPGVRDEAREACCQAISAACEASAKVREGALGARAAHQILHAAFEQDGRSASLIHCLHLGADLLQYTAADAYVDAPEGTLAPLAQFASAPLMLSHVRSILQTSPTDEPMVLTFGTLTPPLGLHRLEAARLMQGLMRTNHRAVFDAVAFAGVMGPLLDLFSAFHWHTLLHLAVYDCVRVVLLSPHKALKLELLNRCNLIDRLLQADALSKSVEPKFGSAGFMGIVTKISKHVIDLAAGNKQAGIAQDADVAAAVQGREDWLAYTRGSLAERMKKESQYLGGRRPEVATSSSGTWAPTVN